MKERLEGGREALFSSFLEVEGSLKGGREVDVYLISRMLRQF